MVEFLHVEKKKSSVASKVWFVVANQVRPAIHVHSLSNLLLHPQVETYHQFTEATGDTNKAMSGTPLALQLF